MLQIEVCVCGGSVFSPVVFPLALTLMPISHAKYIPSSQQPKTLNPFKCQLKSKMSSKHH